MSDRAGKEKKRTETFENSTSAQASANPPGSGIKVVPRSGNEIPYPNCLVVDTQPKPGDSATILATVEHFQENRTEGAFPWTIHQVSEQSLPFEVAMDLAVRFAEDQAIPVILVNQDGMSAERHKQQTDTEILDMSYHSKVKSEAG